MDIVKQQRKAQTFREMHLGPSILVLPNAYDALSARAFEAAGFKAIATPSAGIAFSLGYPDGEVIPRDEMLGAVRRIANCVDVPVSADMESGYARDAAGVADTVRAVIAAGAVGINLEDSKHDGSGNLYEIDEMIERIKAAKEAARSTGVDLVINARTDVFLRAIGEPETRLEHAVRRANAYRDAGADCLYVMGFLDRATIAALIPQIRGPVNILATPTTPPIRELQALGVARVTIGPAAALAALSLFQRIAKELLTSGTYTSFAEAASYEEANALMRR